MTPTPVVSLAPVLLDAPHRLESLSLRVSVPVTGDRLPIILLSHGHGPSHHLSSLNGYGPLANALAGAGFAVLQPTHLDSATLPHRSSGHRDAPLFWRSRAEDMTRILDQLDHIEGAAGWLEGRFDRSRVAVVGHSMGGHTASVLLGARHLEDGGPQSVRDPRIGAGVLLAAPGRGDALTAFAAEHYPFFGTIDFSTMAAPALVVMGDADTSAHLTTAGADWFADPYRVAPPPKALLTLFDAGHGLGGISGYDASETTDENPERVATLCRLVAAYVRSQLDPMDTAWDEAREMLNGSGSVIGRVESK